MVERAKQDIVDEAIDESFPASDPPSGNGGRADPATGASPSVAPPPVGSLAQPLIPTTTAGSALVTPGRRARLLREAPLFGSGALAVGSLALLLAGKRLPATWMLQASTWLLLFGAYQRLGSDCA